MDEDAEEPVIAGAVKQEPEDDGDAVIRDGGGVAPSAGTTSCGEGDDASSAGVGDNATAAAATTAILPPPSASAIVEDLIEYLVEMMFLDQNRRGTHMETLQYFWSLHPGRDHKFGRFYLRKRFADLLMEYCCCESASADEGEAAHAAVAEMLESPAGTAASAPSTPATITVTTTPLRAERAAAMARWDRDRWQRLKGDVQRLAGDLLRKDATAMISTADDGPASFCSEHDKVRAADAVFTRKVPLLLKVLEVNKAIAPLRRALDEAVAEAAAANAAAAAGAENPPVAVALDEGTLQEILDYTDDMEFEDCKETVHRLFVMEEKGSENDDLDEAKERDTEGKPSTAAVPTGRLKDLLAVGTLLSQRPFSAEYVLNKLEALLHRLNFVVFGADDPVLIRLRYHLKRGTVAAAAAYTPKAARYPLTSQQRTPYPTPNVEGEKAHRAAENKGASLTPTDPKDLVSESQVELRKLVKGRAALKERHGEDPLEASRAIASQAKRKRPRQEDEEDKDGDEVGGDDDDRDDAPAAKRARVDAAGTSNSTGGFADELDRDDEEDERQRSHLYLSALPLPPQPNPAGGGHRGTRPRSTASSSTPRKYHGPPPDKGIFDRYGKVKKRRKWTDEEKTAVVEGVKRFGVGKWADIKNCYAEILKNRTSVQIKDVWRTMNKQAQALAQKNSSNKNDAAAASTKNNDGNDKGAKADNIEQNQSGRSGREERNGGDSPVGAGEGRNKNDGGEDEDKGKDKDNGIGEPKNSNNINNSDSVSDKVGAVAMV